MISTMPFGKTGHDSTKIIFGAAALGSVNQDDADKTLEVLLEYGINHFDVAAGYGNGEAEKRMASWMKRCRCRASGPVVDGFGRALAHDERTPTIIPPGGISTGDGA